MSSYLQTTQQLMLYQLALTVGRSRQVMMTHTRSQAAPMQQMTTVR
jgi:hypothetical protein